jgi:hypothetical protein
MLDAGSGDLRVRVHADTDAEPACDVLISVQANNAIKATVHDSIRQDSGATPVAGAAAAACAVARRRSQTAVRAVVIISRFETNDPVQLLTGCARCASVVVAASLDWLFHCCASSTLRSPFLYAVSKALPLSSIHTTSSGASARSLLICVSYIRVNQESPSPSASSSFLPSRPWAPLSPPISTNAARTSSCPAAAARTTSRTVPKL